MADNKSNIDNELKLADNLPDNFDEQKLIAHWISSSDNDFVTMCDMYVTKHFNWTLFIGHLVIEKLLKACFLKTNHQFPPLIHNLLRLAEKANVDLAAENLEFFATVTSFNINSRYDDYKQSFYHICTPEFTERWFEKIKTYRQWLKEKYLK